MEISGRHDEFMKFKEFRDNRSEDTVGYKRVLFDYFIVSGAEPFVLITSGCMLSLGKIPVDMAGCTATTAWRSSQNRNKTALKY